MGHRKPHREEMCGLVGRQASPIHQLCSRLAQQHSVIHRSENGVRLK